MIASDSGITDPDVIEVRLTVKEYKELLNSGEDNSFDRDLRYAFGKAVKNGGSEYMSAYADCYNFFAKQKKNIAGVYKTLGLDQKAMQNEKMLSDSYTASEKAKMQKKYNIDNYIEKDNIMNINNLP